MNELYTRDIKMQGTTIKIKKKHTHLSVLQPDDGLCRLKQVALYLSENNCDCVRRIVADCLKSNKQRDVLYVVK